MAFTQYSSLFTLGLLHEGSSASDQNSSIVPRRGSLPETSTFGGSDDADSFIFSAPRERTAYRSFLSLDLAESQSLRSISNRNRLSLSTTSFVSSQTNESSVLTPRRGSRDSLRDLPSPKPAPSSFLPATPSESAPSYKTSYSSPVSSSPPPARPDSAILNCSSLSPLRSRFSFGTLSSSPSHRSTYVSDALACLEGRHATRLPNFMSMSDEEDDDDDDDEEDEEGSVDEEFETVIPPIQQHLRRSGLPLRSASLFTKPTPPRSPRQAAPLRPRRRNTADSWFILSNFIDLDDDAPSWRSFIEITA